MPELNGQEATFDTALEERRHRKQQLAAAFRIFARFGYDAIEIVG